jgi:hypothetical protein
MSSQISNSTNGSFSRIFRRIIMAVLSVIVGCILAFIASSIIMTAAALHVYTSSNGWVTTIAAGKPGNSIPLRAAIASVLPSTCVAEEAVYCTTTKDSMGQKLNGANDYIINRRKPAEMVNDKIILPSSRPQRQSVRLPKYYITFR